MCLVPGGSLWEGRRGAAIQRVTGQGRYGGRGRTRHYRRRRVHQRQIVSPPGPAPNVRMPGALGSCDSLDLRLLLLNARSVNNKTQIIQDLILDEKADLACITETWLDEVGGVGLSQLCPPGFQVLQQPRSQRRGGGVALVFRESISLTRRPVQQFTGFECLHVVLSGPDRIGILLVYRSPCNPTVSLPELTSVISAVALESPRLLVLGDFNVHAEAPETGSAQDFMAAMTTMGLSQKILAPTHSAGHVLDLVFTTEQEGSDLDVVGINITPLSWSDHFLVGFRLVAASSLRRGGGPYSMVRPRRLMDPDGFLRALGDFPAAKTASSSTALVDLWNGEMARAVDEIAPERPLPCRRLRAAPWFSEELRLMKRQGRRLERRWRKTRDESDRARCRAHYRAYSVAVVAAKRSFFSATIASAANRPAGLFRVVQGLFHSAPLVDQEAHTISRCGEFAKHFSDKIDRIRHDLDATLASMSVDVPLATVCPVLWDSFQLVQPEDVDRLLWSVRPSACRLDPCPAWLIRASREGLAEWTGRVVNSSLMEGVLPPALKQAVIRPLLKKPSLDPTVLDNYRPVSNIPFLGKVIERVVATQLQRVLDEADYLDPFQSGFRPGYGTETALVALVDDLRRGLDRGSASLLVLLDLSAAFDTIDHGVLLGRLTELGVGGTVLQWFRSYLEDRSQMVVLGDACSAPWPLKCGVPQGSILSPMLFNIYMKPLGEVIRGFGVGCHQYADDTQLYLSFPPDSRGAVEVLERCLESVGIWMRANKLKLNPDKTEVLLVRKASMQVLEYRPALNGVALPLKEQVRSLGVRLDSELLLDSQVAAVARGAFAQLRLVRQLRPYLDHADLATVVHAMVTSRLDYCNALYVGLPLKTVRKLQLVQNAAARVVTGARRFDSVGPLLRRLHWLPIRFRAQFKVLVITFKALYSSGPGYLRDRLLPYNPVRPLRSSEKALLQVPPPREVQGAAARNRAFSVVAPVLWNSLPFELRTASSLETFKRGLKTFLFRQAF